MQKRIILFLSIANILYLPGCRSVHGETTLNRPGIEDIVIEDHVKADTNNKDSYLPREKSSELLGKWRNNGEALEPKWRDGDAVPLLPFSHFAQTYTQEETDLTGHNKPYDVVYRDNLNYRQLNENQGGNDYADSRQERFPLPKDSTIRLEERKYGRQSRGKIEHVPVERLSKDKFLRNDRMTSTGYRDAFQVHPNEYEHDLADEEYLKPRPRKRRPPQNEEFILSAKETIHNNERIKLDSILSSNEKKDKASSKKIEAIKSLLKMQQEEGVSLSEILHRKNLTLIDLLKGKADVISALKMKDIDEIGDDIEQISLAMTSTLAKLPSTTLQSILDTTTTKTITTMGHVSTKISQLKETTTETLAAISPSEISIDLNQSDDKTNQNLNTTREIYSDENHDEIMEFSDFTDYKKGRTTASPIWISLITENNAIVRSMQNINLNRSDRGSTLSIVRILNPTVETFTTKNLEKNKPFNKVYTDTIHKEDNSNLAVAEDHFDSISEADYQYDAPLNDMRQDDEIRVSSSIKKNECINDSDKDETIYLEKDKDRSKDFLSKSKNDSSFEETIKTFFKNHPNVEDVMSEGKRYEDIMSEIEPEARAEIFELFASGSGGKNLERLLKSRNMTLEELIALRQRGSSKVHLAEVSRLRNHKALRISEDNQLSEKKHLHNPEEKSIIDELRNETIGIKKLMNETEHIDISQIHPKLIKEMTEFSFTTEISFKTKNYSNEKHEDPNHLIKITELFNTFTSLSFDKDQEQRISKNIEETLNKKTIDDESINIVQSDYAKEMIQNNTEVDINVIYKGSINEVKHDENEDRGKSLSKIKSSIIASGAILGVTIVVFFAIFIACRIRHKQKYRYRNSFPRTVFQSPIATARKLSNTSSLNNIMVSVVATSTTKRSEKNDSQQNNSGDYDPKCDIDNDSLDANDSWETIPDYIK
ncbi:uncharacterized protein LOC118439996 isoform X1 [Vespa mandarinia]|uniref:uncharacterized protein LOC118439996 isoform X1 n=1 Tax=Vespa mandarinia TaxID=7446 RepID=UPI00162082B2|nr:uncharacterized protein LOC118439996 isoform X1 [Vespa mandarinia]